MQLTTSDVACFERAVQLALEAEAQGNLPIGAVISLEGRIMAEGQNAIWPPTFNQNRHAEIEALRSVPRRWRGCGASRVVGGAAERPASLAGLRSVPRRWRGCGASRVVGGAAQRPPATLAKIDEYDPLHNSRAMPDVPWRHPAASSQPSDVRVS